MKEQEIIQECRGLQNNQWMEDEWAELRKDSRILNPPGQKTQAQKTESDFF